jgi:hypothetical protein
LIAFKFLCGRKCIVSKTSSMAVSKANLTRPARSVTNVNPALEETCSEKEVVA